MAARVGQRLDDLLGAEQRRWAALNEDLNAPFEGLRSLIGQGGKRLRPGFLYWGFVGAGGDPQSTVPVDAGAAVELLHAFALFHDDVMDGSVTRRGSRTTHLLFADRHERDGWVGESRRFGEGVAILVGDLAFVYADMLVDGAPPEAMAIWHELRIELNVGQYLDILGTASGERRLDRAEQISRFKSAKYTVERPLQMGALLAAPDRSADLMPALSRYGLALGDAFQLRDDVLGAFGDERVTGKPVGDDLIEGKPTPLLSLATAAANSSQQALLSGVGKTVGPEDVAGIQQVLIDTGALRMIEDRITALTNEAIEAITAAPICTDACQALSDLAIYLADRDG